MPPFYVSLNTIYQTLNTREFGGRPTWAPLQLFDFNAVGFSHFLRVFFRQGYGQDAVFKGCLDAIFLDVADRELTAERMAAAFFADIFLLIVFFIFLFFVFSRQSQDVIVVADVDVFFGNARQVRRQDVGLIGIFDIYLRDAVVAFCRMFKDVEADVINRVREYKITVPYNCRSTVHHNHYPLSTHRSLLL